MEKVRSEVGNRTRNLTSYMNGELPHVGQAAIPQQAQRGKTGLGPKHTGRPEKVINPNKVSPDMLAKLRAGEVDAADLIRTATYRSNVVQVERPLSRTKRVVAQVAIGSIGLVASATVTEAMLNRDLQPHEQQVRQTVSASGLTADVPSVVKSRLQQSVAIVGDTMQSGVKVGKDRFITTESGAQDVGCDARMIAPKRGGRHATRDAVPVASAGGAVDVLAGDNHGMKPLLSGVKPVPVSETVTFTQGETIFTASGPNLSQGRFDTGVAAAGVILSSPESQAEGEAYALVATQRAEANTVPYAGRGVYDANGQLEGLLGEGMSVHKSQVESAFMVDLNDTTGSGWLTIAPVMPVSERLLANAAPVQPNC